MKKKLPVSYSKDVVIPSVFGILIVLLLSLDAYSKYGLGPALVYTVIFGLIVAGLCYMSL